MFIATANTLQIPGPLQDRMEVIQLSGYTEEEKIRIVFDHLLPKQRKNHGLDDSEFKIAPLQCATSFVITPRSQVFVIWARNFQLLRKAVRKIVENETDSVSVNAQS